MKWPENVVNAVADALYTNADSIISITEWRHDVAHALERHAPLDALFEDKRRKVIEEALANPTADEVAAVFPSGVWCLEYSVKLFFNRRARLLSPPKPKTPEERITNVVFGGSGSVYFRDGRRLTPEEVKAALVAQVKKEAGE